MSCETELVQAAQKGDIQAFEELVRAHQQKVYALALRMTRNHHDAEDMMQQCFIKAYRTLPRFKGQSSFFTWVYRIAVNECISHSRKRVPVPLPDEDLVNRAGPSRVTEAFAGGSDRVKKLLAAAIDALPARQKICLLLRQEEELSYSEISERMGCREGTAKALHHQALCSLRKTLSPHLEAHHVF